MRRVVGVGIAVLPWVAHAEVMDKEMAPWQAVPMVLTVGASALCLVFVRRSRLPGGRAGRRSALGRAAPLGRLLRPVHGPAIRAELPEGALVTYTWLFPIQALLPAALVAVGFAARGFRSGSASVHHEE
jgi:hypothetical protein